MKPRFCAIIGSRAQTPSSGTEIYTALFNASAAKEPTWCGCSAVPNRTRWAAGV
jgi:hypothetical protein